MQFLPKDQRGLAPILLIGAIGIILFLVVASLISLRDFRLASFFPKSWTFAAGDGVIPGPMTLSPTFNSVGIEVLFSDDDNKTATASLEFKKTTETNWRKGLDLWRVDGNDDTSPVDTIGRGFYGAALLLEHSTSYDIKITIIDPDGGGSTLTQSVTTRNNNIPKAVDLWNSTPAASKYYVRSNGNDANDGKSEVTAWKSLQKAVVSAPAGAVVQVGPGYYVQPSSQRTTQITLLAQFPAVDDNRNVINSGQHSVIEPGNNTSGESAVSCPTSANDCAYKGVWTRVTGLSAPGFAEDQIATGSALPESVDPNIQIWKWNGAPINASTTLGFATSRSAEPQRVALWTGVGISALTPEGFISKLISNHTYRYGAAAMNSGNDIYLRLPPHAPSQNPNDLYITLGSPLTFPVRSAIGIRGNDSRFSGFEIRNFNNGITLTNNSQNAVIDHNLTYGNRYGVYVQGATPGQYGKNHLIEYNLFKDSGLWTDDPINKSAIPWYFVKNSLVNADGSLYTINNKPGQTAEGHAVGGRGGGQNIVVRFNTVDGQFNGISQGYNLGFNRYGGSNMDVHDNIITHAIDDALEAEQQAINFKAWNNKVSHTLTFLATGPGQFGPYFIFRNSSFRVSAAGVTPDLSNRVVGGTHFKYSGQSIPHARIYVVNNTFWTDQDNNRSSGGSQAASGFTAAERFYLRNNLFRVTHYAFDITANSRDAAAAWNEDYNYFYTSDLTRTFKYNNSTSGVGDLAGYRTKSGQGMHTNLADTAGNVHTSPDGWLTDPTTSNFSLNSATAVGKLIDVGTTVPNIADSFNGCAPDLGAFESGSVGNCPPATPTPSPTPTSVPTASASPLPTPAPISTPDASGIYRIDSATSSAGIDSMIRQWISDGGYIGGGITNRGNIAIANTEYDWIYQTERYNVEGYSVTVPNGNYKIKLHFAETYGPLNAAGQRVFSASVEGGSQINDLDIFNEVGKNTALIKEVTVMVNDGKLDISFSRKTGSPNGPMINGLEIIPSARVGDFDGNGKVDIFDLNRVATDLGKVEVGLITDIVPNGKIDIFDYNWVHTFFIKP